MAFRTALAENFRVLEHDATPITTLPELYEASQGQPDVVLVLDMCMPETNGVHVLHHLGERGFQGLIVLASGEQGRVLPTAARLAQAKNLNVAGYIKKPVRAQDILALIDRAQPQAGLGEDYISEALDNKEIRAFFQPKVSLQTGRIVGAEALSRWEHPKHGLLSPGKYLEKIRKAGRQAFHDMTILELATRQCAAFNARGWRLGVSVNFTVDVLLSDEFKPVLQDLLARSEIDPGQLTIEITEADASGDHQEIAEQMLHLRMLGIRISIDDFGTGHSSLSRLQHLPLNEVKIDRSFVAGLSAYSDDVTIVQSTINMAHALECQVVAEGVESASVARLLKEMDCDTIQGYLVAPALTPDNFVSLVEENRPFL